MKKTLILFLFFFISNLVFAEAPASSEYEIKGAFLYNFAKFVEWPPNAFEKNADSFVIGILGHDPFGSTLDEILDGKTIQDKKLVLRRLNHIEEAAACNVLFISASKQSELPIILASLNQYPVLTVSDMPGFIEHGGVVGLSVENKKVRFGINVKAADSTGLKVSSQLLKLAKTIISKRHVDLSTYVWLPFEIIPSKRS